MTPAIWITIILFIGGGLIAVIWYFFQQLILQLQNLNKSVTEIKISLATQAVEHKNLETRVERVEHKLKIA